jgi:hypothetical protein
MGYNIPPKGKTKRCQFDRTTVKLPHMWPYGKRTKRQWIQAFEEEAKH